MVQTDDHNILKANHLLLKQVKPLFVSQDVFLYEWYLFGQSLYMQERNTGSWSFSQHYDLSSKVINNYIKTLSE